MSDPQLHTLAVDQLVAHPDNPRLTLRQDTIEQIAAEIERDGFSVRHAITVRPHGDDWQIISGHHRVEAAKKCGLDAVPAWSEEMDDDEAFMQLVLANSQGELTPLEIGWHAFNAVGRGKRGRGNTGGLSAYARRVGRSQAYISQLHSAGEVYAALLENHNSSYDFQTDLSDRAKHLCEISKAPRELWPRLVESLAKRSWTVADAATEVGQIRRLTEVVPAEHRDWLRVAALGDAYLRGGRMKVTAVTALIAAADEVLTLADEQGTDADATEFRAWLVANTGGDSWDVRKIREQHQVLMTRIWERRDAEKVVELPDGIDLRAGDFREILDDLADGSVDAIITDPPYPAEFLPLFGRRLGNEQDGGDDFQEDGLAQVAARILKPGGVCAVMVGQSYLPEIIERLQGPGGLSYHWTLAYLTPGGQAVQLWQRKVNTFWKPILIFTNGEYVGDWIGDVAASKVNDNDKEHHFWGQSESGTADLVERLTKPGWLVCDPFLGGGTTAVVCHELGRRFVGCDVEESCVETTRQRFTSAEEDVA